MEWEQKLASAGNVPFGRAKVTAQNGVRTEP